MGADPVVRWWKTASDPDLSSEITVQLHMTVHGVHRAFAGELCRDRNGEGLNTDPCEG
jgi:hypothetical protein